MTRYRVIHEWVNGAEQWRWQCKTPADIEYKDSYILHTDKEKMLNLVKYARQLADTQVKIVRRRDDN